MSVGILVAGEILIPPGIESFDDFRQWALSAEFPEKGRIDYIRGRIVVGGVPDRISFHDELKAEVAHAISHRVCGGALGEVYDETRVSSRVGNISAKPDVLVLLNETIESGNVQLVPTADGTDFVEIEGGPDLVVEIVSPSSVGKDARRLPAAYFDAGVREYWLIDARGEELDFAVFHRGENSFEPTPADAEGFRRSEVLGHTYRLDRSRGRRDEWRYELREEAGGQ